MEQMAPAFVSAGFVQHTPSVHYNWSRQKRHIILMTQTPKREAPGVEFLSTN